jgi:hypothetical protein
VEHRRRGAEARARLGRRASQCEWVDGGVVKMVRGVDVHRWLGGAVVTGGGPCSSGEERGK